MESYVHNSSWFDSHDYDIPKIKKALKQAGAKNIYTDNNYGWENQPKVVIFSGISEKIAAEAVGIALKTEWIIIRKKNW